MAASDVDTYLAGLDEQQRSALETLRRSVREVIPDAEEGLSYGIPAFKIYGKTVAGFAAFTHHLSYVPHSGSVLPALADDLAGYQRTKGSLHFASDSPLPDDLVRKLVTTRLAQLGIT